MRPACGRRAAILFYLSLVGLVRVCDVELSHMGKNVGNPDLVCENIGITHVFSCINICRVHRKLFEHEGVRLSVQTSTEGPCKMCDRYSCIFYLIST